MAFSFGTLAWKGVSNSFRHACAKGETVMAFSTGGRGPFQGQMNVTPLIDVLLVLIIVFMVVQSMMMDKGLNTQIPQPQTDRTLLRQRSIRRSCCRSRGREKTRRPNCESIKTISVGNNCSRGFAKFTTCARRRLHLLRVMTTLILSM